MSGSLWILFSSDTPYDHRIVFTAATPNILGNHRNTHPEEDYNTRYPVENPLLHHPHVLSDVCSTIGSNRHRNPIWMASELMVGSTEIRIRRCLGISLYDFPDIFSVTHSNQILTHVWNPDIHNASTHNIFHGWSSSLLIWSVVSCGEYQSLAFLSFLPLFILILWYVIRIIHSDVYFMLSINFRPLVINSNWSASWLSYFFLLLSWDDDDLHATEILYHNFSSPHFIAHHEILVLNDQPWEQVMRAKYYLKQENVMYIIDSILEG